MPESQQKKQILEDANYAYHFSRDIYYNRADKKIFSLEAIEDNVPEWLKERIAEENISGEWQFFFNNPPSDKIRKEILKELEG